MTINPLLLAAAAVALIGAAPPGEVRIADSDVYPESLDADHAGRLYIGSIKGIVFRTAPNGDVAEPWIRPDETNGLLSLLGIVVDAPRGTLWVCSSPMPLRKPPAVGTSALVAFDLKSGAFKARYPLPAPASACNDIAIARDRTLYLTDTPNGRLFTLAPGAKELALFAQDARLKGADGIAFAGDGTLYVNTVSTNTMVRIDRTKDGRFAGLTPLTLSQPIAGPDGLRPIGGNRFLQAEGNSGKITLVTISGDRAQIKDIATGLNSAPGIAPARGRAYAVEGKITYLFDPKLKGQDPGPFTARPIPLP